MIPRQFAYFVGCILFFIEWTVLFLMRRDMRREMLIMGIIGTIGSLILAYYETIDWWHPLTLTGTRIGIEDALLGFSNAGIAAVLYEEFFHKRLYKRKSLEHSRLSFFLVFLAIAFFMVLFHFFHVSSFLGSTVALSIFSLVMIFMRRDLFVSSVLNGLLMVGLALPIYYLLMLLSPTIIDQTYYPTFFSRLRFTNIPLEEIIFYFIFGCMCRLLFEFWHGLLPRKIPSRRVSARK